ncbi:ribokinase [Frondihabitans sucicola]|uniref:Ribokinase n=1 Tax=Frondihabitans sucicola TaxID=1268041 RepID=A0ABN6XZ68_9MICO|nr:ribokinase [Frondihabitans sucicola]BDZ49413.1 ribokinase [Frondihabitans sucicola]
MSVKPLVIVGSLNADLVVQTERFPRAGETLHGSPLRILPGGKSSNQAAAAARLGGEVRLVGAVGDDDNGRMLVAAARESGVDTRGVALRSDSVTGTAVITVDAQGENTIVISAGANGTLSAADVEANRVSFDGASVLGLCLEVGIDAVLAAARAGREAGLTVLTNLSPYAAVPDDLLLATDVVLLNEHEAAQLLGVDLDAVEWSDVGAAIARLGVPHAVITTGSAGCVVLSGDDSPVTVPSPRVGAVDTTGCGDAFMGALALRLAEGDALVAAATFAVRVGSFAATRHGAQSSYPTPAELETFSA